MTSLNESILTDSLFLAQQQLQGFAQSENFWAVFDSVFGTEYDHAQAEAIQQAWQTSDFSQLPEIQVLDSASMPGIQGGFSAQTGKIYINADFLANATADQITAVLLEEIGHSLDSQVTTTDTAGDEGELFSNYVRGIEINQPESAVMKSENDQIEVVVDGIPLTLEASSQATYTVTFNNLSGTPSSYIEQGLRFSSDHLHTSDENYNGSPEVFGHSGGTDNIRIDLAAGGKFSLFEIDTLAVPSWSSGSNNIIFTAYRDGVQVGQRNVPTGQHVVFGADFQNIDYIDWFSQSGALAIETLKFSARSNNAPTLTGTKATLNAGTEDTAYTISTSDLLTGFTDVDGDTLSVSNLSASNGNLVTNNNGTYTFTPNANYNGTINLSYNVVDGYGGSVAATQSFTLAAVNDAPAKVTQTFAFEYPDNNIGSYPPSFSENGFVFQGFYDYPYGYGVNNSGMTYTSASSNWATGGADGAIRRAEGQDFSLKSFSASTYSYYGNAPYVATLLGFNDGVEVASRTISYGLTHQNFTFDSSWNSVDEVRFNLPYNEVVNGTYYSNQLIFLDNLVVGAATATLAAGTEDTVYTISQTDLLTGFTDVDSDTLSISNLTASNGSLVNNNDGTWSFTPAANYNGAVNLNYNVTDGKGGSISATQSFTLAAVNDAATLTGRKATLAAGTEDTVYTISQTNLLTGFTDVEGDTLWVSHLTASNGSLVDNNNGTWSFTPTANYNGSVNLNYNVTDGNGGSTEATQSFTLAAVNDAPTGSASASLVAGTEDTPYTISKAQLLAGFSDVDGNALSITNFATNNGSFVENEDGSFTITGTNNYNGAVTVNYKVSDGSLSVDASNSFNLAAVNDAPTGLATASLVAGTEDTAYTISKAQLLAGFSDVDGNALSITNFATNNGSFVENEDGSFTITGANNYNGAVTVNYKVSDGSLSVDASNSFNLAAVNDAATLTGEKATLAAGSEDTVYTISQSDLLTGFSDVDGDTLSVSNLTASNGSLVNNNNGTWSFTPAANYNGAVNLTYNVTDGKVDSAEATQSFSIAAVNDTPTATNESLTTAEDVPLVISAATLLGNDADVDLGDSLSIAAVTQPSKGGLINNGNGTYTYTPNANYNGADSFTYTISDRAGATSTATVNLTVNAVNDNPDAVSDIVTARQGTPKTILAAELLANDTDVDGNTLSLTNVSNAQNGTVALDNNGNVIFTANANVSTASFEYTLSDGNGGTDSAIVTLLVGKTLNGGNGTDPLSGTAGDDILNGGNGNDTLLGLAGDDILSGGNGIDNLQGGEGKDRLYGGRGNDLLTGGLGSDIFVLMTQSGTDTIQDFADGEDKIGLAGGLTFGQLTIGSSNGNTLISKDGGEVLAILAGTNSSLITQADFISVM